MQEISVEDRAADVVVYSMEHVDLAVTQTIFALPPLSCTIRARLRRPPITMVGNRPALSLKLLP
jgi:hypothetical protein